MILRRTSHSPSPDPVRRRTLFWPTQRAGVVPLDSFPPASASLSPACFPLTYLDCRRFAGLIALTPAREQPRENRQETQKPHLLHLASIS